MRSQVLNQSKRFSLISLVLVLLVRVVSRLTTQLDCTDDQTGYSDEPSGHIRIVGRDYATAAETFTLSRSATDTSNDGGSSKCWCLHFVQVTASVILNTAC